jgi:hypothetical protein
LYCFSPAEQGGDASGFPTAHTTVSAEATPAPTATANNAATVATTIDIAIFDLDKPLMLPLFPPASGPALQRRNAIEAGTEQRVATTGLISDPGKDYFKKLEYLTSLFSDWRRFKAQSRGLPGWPQEAVPHKARARLSA